ncbi:dynamin family protein [Sulfurihydrogenibium sp.]|uniref:dynamin family protein n=1 Tax=Sulfurihydrogenibium sp. TaxID=2053621 RepID=UPI00260EDE0F|nr:dynamin family protein [Sulfurihydrogenibium sp.]
MEIRVYKKVESIDVDIEILEDIKENILENLKKIRESTLKAKDQEIKICIVATKKAGKSMVANCFLKEEYAPTSAELPTPCIIKYTPNKDSDSIELYELNYEYKDENDKSLSELKVERKHLRDYESPEEVKKELENVFKSVKKEGKRTPDYEIKYPISKDSNLNYVVYDTPGPDLAGSEHRIGLKEVIKDSDVVIFVIDYTKYAIDSEVELFGKVLSLFDKRENVLIVAVNKMDGMYLDQDTEKITSRVADFIREKYKALERKIVEKAKEEGKNIEHFEIISIPTSAMWYFYLTKTAEKYPQIKEKLEHIEDIEDNSMNSYISEIDVVVSRLKRIHKNNSPTYEDAINLSNFETLIRYTNYIAQEKAYISRVSKLINDIDISTTKIANTINSNKLTASGRKDKILQLMQNFIYEVNKINENQNVEEFLEGYKDKLLQTSDDVKSQPDLFYDEIEYIDNYLMGLKEVVDGAKKFTGENPSDYRRYMSSLVEEIEERRGIELSEFDPNGIIKAFNGLLSDMETRILPNIKDTLDDLGKKYKQEIENIYERLKSLVDTTNRELVKTMENEAKTLGFEGIKMPSFRPTIDLSGVKNIVNTEINIQPIDIDFFDPSTKRETRTRKEKIQKEVYKGLGFLFWRWLLDKMWETVEEEIDVEYTVEVFDKERTIEKLESVYKDTKENLNKLKRYIENGNTKIVEFTNLIEYEVEKSLDEAKEQYKNFITSILKYANNAINVLNTSIKEQEKILGYVTLIESGEDGFKSFEEFWNSVYKN